jgi:RIO-like serine/threonine protein kinase
MLLSVGLTTQLWMNSTDCLSLAHEHALRAGILHHDFSPGNIIISPDGTGLLIDWDMSKPTSKTKQKVETPRCATRTVRAKGCVTCGHHH